MQGKALYLLRHAEADHSFSDSDMMRQLTAHGRHQAREVARLMRQKNWVPGKILVSSAMRTRMTVEAGQWDSTVDVQIAPRLYNAEPEGLIHVIQEQPRDIESLLVVAHNPGIHQLAVALSRDEAGNDTLFHLSMGYPPATLSVLTCPVQDWSELEIGQNVLDAVIRQE